jgi:hypothetical protein
VTVPPVSKLKRINIDYDGSLKHDERMVMMKLIMMMMINDDDDENMMKEW